MRFSRLTRFVARYEEGVLADCLCFGDPVHQHIEANECTVYHFRPDQVFGLMWWRQFEKEQHHRALAVVQALSSGQPGQSLPGIESYVHVLTIVEQHGPAGQDGAVDQMLDLINDLKHRGRDPAQLPPGFWVEASQQILIHGLPDQFFVPEPAG